VDAFLIAGVVFVCTFGGAMLGTWLRGVLPAHHFDKESKDTVMVSIGLIATMTALVLGLVTASAKSAFDDLDAAVKHTAADVLTLDRTLARYGSASTPIRDTLKELVAKRLAAIWPERGVAQEDPIKLARSGERISEQILDLEPQTDEQRWLKTRALESAEDLLKARWVVVSSVGSSIPTPFLVVLIFWLTITFASFGLFAPRNGTVIAALFVCTLSVAGAMFLILEMDSPFQGLTKISADPMRYAFSRLEQ
jgi:hypothetical protein